MKKSALKQLVREVVSEIGRMRRPLSPKYAAQKQRAADDYALGYDHGYTYILDRMDEPDWTGKTKSYKAGFQAGMTDAIEEEEQQSGHLAHPPSYTSLRR